jgi:hypothetical protein
MLMEAGFNGYGVDFRRFHPPEQSIHLRMRRGSQP